MPQRFVFLWRYDEIEREQGNFNLFFYPVGANHGSILPLKTSQHIVISPGSRNAPLTKGFTSDPYFKTYSIVDERAAAFFALGIAPAQTTGRGGVYFGFRPVELLPAVAEAYYSDIPLVVLSADRMPHRIDIGDGQTIRQTQVFEPHVERCGLFDPRCFHATATLLAHPTQNVLKKGRLLLRWKLGKKKFKPKMSMPSIGY